MCVLWLYTLNAVDETVQKQHLNQYNKLIYIENVVRRFICCLMVAAKNLIWPEVSLFFCSWWPVEEYLQRCFIMIKVTECKLIYIYVFQVCRTLFCQKQPFPFLLKTIFLFIGYIFILQLIFFQNTLLWWVQKNFFSWTLKSHLLFSQWRKVYIKSNHEQFVI